MAIRVQQAAFDPGQELNALHAQNVGIGAVVGFVGYVRDFNDGREVGGMFLEHYPGMTEKALGKIAAEAGQRWPLLRLEILHRIGRLEPGEPIVFVEDVEKKIYKVVEGLELAESHVGHKVLIEGKLEGEGDKAVVKISSIKM